METAVFTDHLKNKILIYLIFYEFMYTFTLVTSVYELQTLEKMANEDWVRNCFHFSEKRIIP